MQADREEDVSEIDHMQRAFRKLFTCLHSPTCTQTLHVPANTGIADADGMLKLCNILAVRCHVPTCFLHQQCLWQLPAVQHMRCTQEGVSKYHYVVEGVRTIESVRGRCEQV
jgi:hypothetical protein